MSCKVALAHPLSPASFGIHFPTSTPLPAFHAVSDLISVMSVATDAGFVLYWRSCCCSPCLRLSRYPHRTQSRAILPHVNDCRWKWHFFKLQVQLTTTLACSSDFISLADVWRSPARGQSTCMFSFAILLLCRSKQTKKNSEICETFAVPPLQALVGTFEPHACSSQRRLLPDRQQTRFDRWPGSVTGSLQRTLPVSTHFLLSAPLT